MTSIEIKQAQAKVRKPSKVVTRKLTKAQLAERRKAAGLSPKPPVVAKSTVASTPTKPVAKSGNTPKAASQRDALRTAVVKAWKASKVKDASARRKAIATKLNCRGQVLGLLREAGIDGKSV